MIEKLLEERIKGILDLGEISTEDLIKCYLTIWAEKEKMAIPKDLEKPGFLSSPNASILLDLDPKSFFLSLPELFFDVASSYEILSSMEKDLGRNTLVSLTVLAVKKSLDSETLWDSESESKKGYEEYRKTMALYKYSAYVIIYDDYTKLKASMSKMKVDEEVLTVTGIVPGRESDNARKAAAVMKNDLKLSYENQYRFLDLVYSNNPQRKDLMKDLGLEKNTLAAKGGAGLEQKRKYQRDKINECRKYINKVGDPLVILKAIELYKKTRNVNGKGYSSGNDKDVGNVLLETGIFLDEVRRLCLSEVWPFPIIWLLPSFSLIEKVMKDLHLSKTEMTFFLRSKEEADILSLKSGEIKFKAMADLGPETLKDSFVVVSDPSSLEEKERDEILTAFSKSICGTLAVLDSDASFVEAKSLATDLRGHITNITLFPLGLASSRNSSKRCMWSAGKESVQEFSLINLGKNEDMQSSYIYVDEEKTQIDKDSFFRPEIPLRAMYREYKESLRKSGYGRSEIVEFTSHFRMTLSTPDSHKLDEKGRYKSEFFFQYKDENEKWNTIRDTSHGKRVSSIVEAKTYALCDYPTSLKSLGGKGSPKIPMGQIVREALLEKGCSCEGFSLKETAFLLFDIVLNLPETESEAVQSLSFNSQYSDTPLSDILPQLLLEDEDLAEEYRMDALFSGLNKLIKGAAEYGFIKENPFYKAELNNRRWNKIFSSIRALAKKTLSDHEFILIYETLKDRVNHGDSKAFCALISLLTGLETNIVCGLKWKDVVFSDYGNMMLEVYKQVSSDGKAECAFEDMNDYRIFPLDRILERMLSSKKELARRKLAGTGISINDVYVVRSVESETEHMSECLPPKAVSPCVNELIKTKLGIKEDLVSIPTEDNGTKDTDLSLYSGNLLRENFRFHAETKCSLTEDELCYLLGNDRATTMGCHYIDFENQEILLSLKIKLDRLASFLEGSGEIAANKGYFKSPRPTAVEYVFESDGKNLDIEADSMHGVVLKVEDGNAHRDR